VVKAYSTTDIGRKRTTNQDYVFASTEQVGKLPNLFLVADGMGGHNAGDFASRYAAEIMVQEIRRSEEDQIASILRHAIEAANAMIRLKASEDSAMLGMGTTLVAASIKGKRMEVANVGDSRLYVAEDTLHQITRDHSLVEEMVRMGGLKPEEARKHPDKNIITRAVGASPTVRTDLFEVELSQGCLVLLCSDGLTNMLEDEEICSILKEDASLKAKAERLITRANEKGGRDNIAVVLIDPFDSGNEVWNGEEA